MSNRQTTTKTNPLTQQPHHGLCLLICSVFILCDDEMIIVEGKGRGFIKTAHGSMEPCWLGFLANALPTLQTGGSCSSWGCISRWCCPLLLLLPLKRRNWKQTKNTVDCDVLTWASWLDWYFFVLWGPICQLLALIPNWTVPTQKVFSCTNICRILPVFSSCSSSISGFTLGSLIHLHWFLCTEVDMGLTSFLYIRTSSFSSAICRRCCLFSGCIFGDVVKY